MKKSILAFAVITLSFSAFAAEFPTQDTPLERALFKEYVRLVYGELRTPAKNVATMNTTSRDFNYAAASSPGRCAIALLIGTLEWQQEKFEIPLGFDLHSVAKPKGRSEMDTQAKTYAVSVTGSITQVGTDGKNHTREIIAKLRTSVYSENGSVHCKYEEKNPTGNSAVAVLKVMDSKTGNTITENPAFERIR